MLLKVHEKTRDMPPSAFLPSVPHVIGHPTGARLRLLSGCLRTRSPVSMEMQRTLREVQLLLLAPVSPGRTQIRGSDPHFPCPEGTADV